MVNVRTAFDGIPVSNAMLTDFQVLHQDEALARAVQLILAGTQQDFPVVENGNVVGILTRDKLMSALAEHGQNYPVSDVMSKDFEKVESSEMLQSAMMRLQNCDCRTMPVIKKGELIGLLNMENIGEFMMIHSALKKASRTA